MSQRRVTRARSEKNQSIQEIFDTMDQTIQNCDFQRIETNDEDIDRKNMKILPQSVMYEASAEYTEHHHRIVGDLMKRGEENDPEFVASFQEHQTKSDVMLRKYGGLNNDLVALDSKCQRDLGNVFVTASATRLKTTDNFNWVRFKHNIRTLMKEKATKFDMPIDEQAFMFENAFPASLVASKPDTHLNLDFSWFDPEIVINDQDENEETKISTQRAKSVNYRAELKEASKVPPSQPKISDANKEDDRELLVKLERKIIEIEKKNGRKPMPMIRLACDPNSFQRTVENFSKLSFLLQQGTLLYFVENGEKMVITKHNADKTDMKIEEPGKQTQYLHYDIRTYEQWIKKYNVFEPYLIDL